MNQLACEQKKKSGMNWAQVVTLAQFFQEQLRQRSSGRGELFGQVASQLAAPFVAEFAVQGLPLPSAALQGSGSVASGNGQNCVRDPSSFSSDPFSKSEKWLGIAPYNLHLKSGKIVRVSRLRSLALSGKS